ncbi:MAG TPA: lysylphosphatidylglycerol synthase domain-containing protein [Xanthobacteraceae bacterium]|nr:lysylphosphatidylglycerol synthase domain-containing protein [Xanthobacteraceae bacterium]
MTSRLIDRLVAVATIAIFCIAIAVLVREFANISPREVLDRLATLPRSQILAAVGLTAASYLLLTGYDFLALRYIGRRLRVRDVLFAGFTAFAFSNNIGFQLLSGGSIRYRIYSRFGLAPVEIGEIVVFCTVTYALGAVTVGGLLAWLDPAELAAAAHVPRPLLSAGGTILLAVSVAYLAVVAVWRKPVAVGRYRLRPPSLMLAFLQLALASVDALLAGAVMYVLLPAGLHLSYESFFGIYLVAAVVSVLSLVPGGLGVFEAVVSVMIGPSSKVEMLGAFLLYRIIYFLVPLAAAIVCFAVHEFRRRFGKQTRPSSVPAGDPARPGSDPC